jgi:hypothetical protein
MNRIGHGMMERAATSGDGNPFYTDDPDCGLWQVRREKEGATWRRKMCFDTVFWPVSEWCC